MSDGSGSQENSSGGGTAAIALGATGCAGCLASPVVLLGGAVLIIIFGGLGVLFMPIVVLILLFGGGGDGGGSSAGDTDKIAEIFQGDGKGTLSTENVPSDLRETVQDAGEVCDAIGPVVIAAQIEYHSGWNPEKVGEDGQEGISQIDPDAFEKHGKDDDDNDETSALDDKDSIMAQGRYMCELYDDAKELVDSGQATGDALDLTLAAYAVGIDAIREAEGLPRTNAAQGAVAGVRAQFALYQGHGAAPPRPTRSEYSSPSPSPSPSSSPTDDAYP